MSSPALTTERMAQIPVIETENLRLRAPVMADMEAYLAFGASERSIPVGGPHSEAEVFVRLSSIIGHWALRGYGRFLVADKITNEALGIVGPHYPPDWPQPELSGTVFNGAEGRSIAYEAAIATRTWVYETLGWSDVISCVAPHNFRSQQLLKRLNAVKADTYFAHPDYGMLQIWHHPSRGALS